jgi:hypothetical protein
MPKITKLRHPLRMALRAWQVKSPWRSLRPQYRCGLALVQDGYLHAAGLYIRYWLDLVYMATEKD